MWAVVTPSRAGPGIPIGEFRSGKKGDAEIDHDPRYIDDGRDERRRGARWIEVQGPFGSTVRVGSLKRLDRHRG
jgi:hypothetical protein